MTKADGLTDSGGARQRILDSAIRCVIRNGSHGASMAVIASESGMSKALLHYHFADRAHLFAEVVTQLGHRVVVREQAAMEGSEKNSSVDVLWEWMRGELECGELRALLALSTIRETEVRMALDCVSAKRHVAAATTVTRVFERLALVSRVPAELVGHATVAFLDGLALDHEHEHGLRDARTSFDVFWLAFLSLGD